MAGARTPGPLVGLDTVIDDGTMCRALMPAPGSVGRTPDSFGAGAQGEGMQIVLTPIQLAAVLQADSVDPEATASNRIWGAVTLIGGALELVGAGALLLAPEPTMGTKVAGVALGAHGVDTASAGVRQMVTGEATSTFTAATARSAAELMGADPRTAQMIGLGADIAPSLLAGAVGALRVLAVRRGVVRLVADEAAGGHTIARHVGRTPAELQARLAAQPAIPAASTFHTLADAERVVSQALRANRAAIQAWAQASAGARTLTLHFDAGRAIGIGIVRGSSNAVPMTRVLVVLRRVQQGNRTHFVLTAYPKP